MEGWETNREEERKEGREEESIGSKTDRWNRKGEEEGILPGRKGGKNKEV